MVSINRKNLGNILKALNKQEIFFDIFVDHALNTLNSVFFGSFFYIVGMHEKSVVNANGSFVRKRSRSLFCRLGVNGSGHFVVFKLKSFLYLPNTGNLKCDYNKNILGYISFWHIFYGDNLNFFLTRHFKLLLPYIESGKYSFFFSGKSAICRDKRLEFFLLFFIIRNERYRFFFFRTLSAYVLMDLDMGSPEIVELALKNDKDKEQHSLDFAF